MIEENDADEMVTDAPHEFDEEQFYQTVIL